MQHPDVQQLQDAYAEDIGVGIAPVAVDNFARSSHDSRLSVRYFSAAIPWVIRRIAPR